MSQENVEIVRAVYETYARGDLEETFRYFHEDIVWSAPPDNPGGAQRWTGHAGVRGAVTEWVGAWDDFRLEVRALRDHGDYVLAETRQSGRGKGSGIEVSEEMFSVWTVRDGLIVEQQLFRQPALARQAAGIPDSPAPQP
jgi:ketosteroid isomerase-like protein